MCNLSITQVFDGYIGYVRRVTHDEIADAVGQNLREVPGTRTSLAVKARVILTPNLEINTLPVHRLPLAMRGIERSTVHELCGGTTEESFGFQHPFQGHQFFIHQGQTCLEILL